MIRYAGDGPVRIPGTTLGVGVLEAPLYPHRAIELGQKICFGRGGIAAGSVRRANNLHVAIGPHAAVVVVLDYDGPRSIVAINGGRNVPSKTERAQVVALRVDMQQIAHRVAVTRVS